MLRRDPNYTRLPGGGRTLTGNASYWLARDHLLLVDVQTASERYRRFDLRDIRSLTLVATRVEWFYRAFWGGGFLVILAVLVGSLISARSYTNGDWMGFIAFSATGALFLARLLWVLYTGPSCRLEIETAVQTVRLPGLTRWRRTEKFLALVSTAVQTAQADLIPVACPVTEAPPAATPNPEPPTTEEPLPNS